MPNQPIIFGLIGGGALLLTAAITDSSLGQTIQGHAKKVGSGGLYGGLVGAAGARSIQIGKRLKQNGGMTVTNAGGLLSKNQQTFAKRLAQDTGLDPNVIAAWMHNEEPAMLSNSPRGNNNWLNVGITDSGSYGYANTVWNNPTSAADATAAWMQGTPIGDGSYSATGYPPASAGIQSILATAGQSADIQIAAIQGSGWATGGEAAMKQIYQSLVGG